MKNIKFACWAIMLAISVAVSRGQGNATSECGQREKAVSYLDVAIEMMQKVKISFPSCPKYGSNYTQKAIDCADLYHSGYNTSGVYTVWPKSRVTDDKPLDVYCDMNTAGGGWTVIQRRGNFLRPNDYFYKDWQSYKTGFGDIEKDFWLGNDNIYALSNQRLSSVGFDLKDVEGNRRYALYDTFWIDDEDHKYTLHISDYSGDAGDSMIQQHNNQKFSTKDQKNNNQKDENCAQKYKGGWWYNSCHHSNLNGLYLRGKHESFADGVNWLSFKGYKESLDTTEIKIRPKNFRLSPIFVETPIR